MNTEHFADTNLRVSDSLRKTWLRDWTHYFHITSSSLLIHLFTQPYVLKDGRLLVDTWKRLGGGGATTTFDCNNQDGDISLSEHEYQSSAGRSNLQVNYKKIPTSYWTVQYIFSVHLQNTDNIKFSFMENCHYYFCMTKPSSSWLDWLIQSFVQCSVHV